MMNKKSFHLKWNNHLQNLQSLFENLYNEQSLVDVTISCSDGLLYGHKLLLSACSPYFEQVFKDNPCKHPVLILKGINRHDMHILLEYMYTGSVDVGEEDLEMLLDVATELQIKGLVQKSEETNLYPSNKITKHDKTHNFHNNLKSTSPVPQPHSEDLKWQAELVAKPASTKPKDNNSFHQNPAVKEQNDNSQTMPLYHRDSEIKLEEPFLDNEIIEGTSQEDEYQENTEEESNECTATEFLEESSENMEVNFSFQEPKASESDEVHYFCHVCTRAFQNKNSYQRHMTTHAGVKPHHCTFCDQSFLRLSHLQRHIRVHTGERPYSCGQCPKQFARSDKLRQHYIIQHNTSGAKVSKPRGRPRKNPEFYPPTSLPSPSSPSVSSMYSVSINPVSINIG